MDIDIDVIPNFSPKSIFPIIHASTVEQGELKKHLVGVYFQDIPVDKITGLSAIPYKEAEDFGYFKIDMLSLSLLKNFQSKAEMRKLLELEPNWDLLQEQHVVEKLFHLSKHFHIVKQLSPRSVEELADCLAIIRPNKIRLLDKYLKNKSATRIELYRKNDASDLRKSHAIPYALLIVLQLHLLEK